MQLEPRPLPVRAAVLLVPEDPTAGNERLTASTATLLLALLAVEGVTILSIRQLLPVHIVVGMLLIPPVALKLASTGYRFVRYYGGNHAYVAKGPPQLIMRLLAPTPHPLDADSARQRSRATRAGAGPAGRRAWPPQNELSRVVRRDERARPRLRPSAPAAPLLARTASEGKDRARRRILARRGGAGRRHVFARKPLDPPCTRARARGRLRAGHDRAVAALLERLDVGDQLPELRGREDPAPVGHADDRRLADDAAATDHLGDLRVGVELVDGSRRWRAPGSPCPPRAGSAHRRGRSGHGS